MRLLMSQKKLLETETWNLIRKKLDMKREWWENRLKKLKVEISL